MILDLKEKKLFYIKTIKKEWVLSNQDIELLEILKDGNFHTAQELVEKCNRTSDIAIITNLSRLRKRGIKIKVKYGVGYKLENTLNILGEIWKTKVIEVQEYS